MMLIYSAAKMTAIPFMPKDLLLLAAPLFGASINVLSQIVLGRLFAPGRLLGMIVAAFVIG
jgi:hypothetical protein